VERITEPQDGIETVTNRFLSWIDIRKPTREKLTRTHEISFLELNIEDCLSKIQIPKVDIYDNHIFVILNFSTVDKDKGLPRPTQLSMFAGHDYLVTIQQGDLKPLSEAFQLCKVDQNYRELFMGNSSGYRYTE
jgi:magnesium transporter